jgi:DNA-binding transcriptional LysR family regulator
MEKVQVSGSLTSIGGAPLLEAGIQGVGFMMLPEWMVMSHILDDPNTKPVIRAFIDHLLTALKRDEGPTILNSREH